MSPVNPWPDTPTEPPHMLAQRGGPLYIMAVRIGHGRFAARDALTAALRGYLLDEIREQGVPMPAADYMRAWADEVLIENLVEWLNRDGWNMLTTEDRLVLTQAVERAFTSTRRVLAVQSLARLVEGGGSVAKAMADLQRGTDIVDRINRVGPPTFAGHPPDFETLRFMLSGQLWAILAAGLTDAPGERWLLTLAGVWVEHRAQAEVKRWRDWRPPALVSPMVRGLVAGHTGNLQLPDMDGLAPFPSADQRAIERIIEQAHADACAVLRTPDAWRGLSLEIYRAHEQRLNGDPKPHVLVFRGGYRGMSEEAGAKQDIIRRLVALQACGMWQLPEGARGNLLTLTEGPPPAPGRETYIKLELGEFLCHGFVHTMEKMPGRAAERRRLVPWIPPPDGFGNPQTWGAQAAFQSLVLAYFRDHAQELLDGKGVELNAQTLRKEADMARLPLKMVGEVLAWWAGKGNRLALVSPGRYTIADAWGHQRAAIIDGAKQSRARSKAARMAGAEATRRAPISRHRKS